MLLAFISYVDATIPAPGILANRFLGGALQPSAVVGREAESG